MNFRAIIAVLFICIGHISSSSGMFLLEIFYPKQPELTENTIIEFVEKGNKDQAKNTVRKLFYEDRRRRVPTLGLILKLSKWKTDEEILSLIIQALPYNDLSYYDILALGHALEVAAQEQWLIIFETLHTLFSCVYQQWDFGRFSHLDEESYKKVTSLGTQGPLLYQTICHAYLSAFDKAVLKGHMTVIKQLEDSPYLINKAHNWRYAPRPRTHYFKSALHAACLSPNPSQMIDYLLGNGMVVTPQIIEEIQKVEKNILGDYGDFSLLVEK